MSHELLRDSSFFFFLLLIDRDIAVKTGLTRCPHCGGLLDVANYPRKPCGALCKLPDGFCIRFSMCCRKDGCRRRLTPASVRFLDRRVYLGFVTIIVTLMREKCPRDSYVVLQAELGVDFHTIQSWKKFWTQIFPRGDRARIIRSWFPEGGSSDDLLLALWNRFIPVCRSAMETAIAAVRMLVMILTDGPSLDEIIIKQLSVLAYPQDTPADVKNSAMY
jgi:hypothetical protein